MLQRFSNDSSGITPVRQSHRPIDQHHPVSCLGRLGDFFILYEAASDRLTIALGRSAWCAAVDGGPSTRNPKP